MRCGLSAIDTVHIGRGEESIPINCTLTRRAVLAPMRQKNTVRVWETGGYAHEKTSEAR